jgi:hypothetical protein
LLAFCAAIYFDRFNPLYNAFLLVLLVAYFYCDFVMPAGRLRNQVRFLLVTLIVMMLVVMPTLIDIPLRHAAGSAYERVNDSAIQTEEAVKFLLAGKSPYIEDYAHTPMAQWPLYLGLPPEQNIDLRYYPSMPLMFIMPVPFQLLATSVFGYFDVRMYQVLVFLFLYFLLYGLSVNWENKLTLAILVPLNPMFVPYFIEGRNDVVPLAALVAMFFFLVRGRITTAAVLLGLAAMLKATTWFAIPFFFLHLWWRNYDWRAIARNAFAPFAAVCAIIAVPFLVWDVGAFLGDTIWFRSAIFMIWGHGFSRFVLDFGFLPDRYAPFPFAALQLLFGIVALIILARWQRNAPTLKRLLISTVILGFVYAYFGRSFNNNLIGFYFSLALLALGLDEVHSQVPPVAAPD